MNKDINITLAMLVPILRANGEKVKSIEAVHNWYKSGNREYMKEVAEITYDNGIVRYADIGGDSNLTALYDIIGVIQQIRPRSEEIERIERDVYEKPKQSGWIPCSERLPEPNKIVLVTQSYSWKNFEEGAETTIGRHNGKYWEFQHYRPDFKHGTIMDNGIICPGSEYVDAWQPLPEPYREDEA